MKYWDQHCLPSILILHHPDDQLTVWQWADLKTARETDKGWCIDVPRGKRFDAQSAAELNDQVWNDDEIGLRRRFAIDREFMKRFEGREVFVIIDKWLNKHLQYREILIQFGDRYDAEEKYEIPVGATWDFEIADLMRHFLPWLDYDYYEEPDDRGTGEIEQHVLQASLSKAATAFLELERFFAEPWVRDSEMANDGQEPSGNPDLPFSYDE